MHSRFSVRFVVGTQEVVHKIATTKYTGILKTNFVLFYIRFCCFIQESTTRNERSSLDFKNEAKTPQ